jgi:RNA polymerase sigma-70 factor, ECF subfamily
VVVVPTDEELTRAAQAGDTGALGLLLARHQAGMRAVALGVHAGQGEHGGRDLVVRGMEGDLAAGVRQRLKHTVASRGITIWEMDMINPVDDPAHCPPAVTWLVSLAEGRIRRIRLFHPR